MVRVGLSQGIIPTIPTAAIATSCSNSMSNKQYLISDFGFDLKGDLVIHVDPLSSAGRSHAVELGDRILNVNGKGYQEFLMDKDVVVLGKDGTCDLVFEKRKSGIHVKIALMPSPDAKPLGDMMKKSNKEYEEEEEEEGNYYGEEDGNRNNQFALDEVSPLDAQLAQWRLDALQSLEVCKRWEVPRATESEGPAEKALRYQVFDLKQKLTAACDTINICMSRMKELEMLNRDNQKRLKLKQKRSSDEDNNNNNKSFLSDGGGEQVELLLVSLKESKAECDRLRDENRQHQEAIQQLRSLAASQERKMEVLEHRKIIETTMHEETESQLSHQLKMQVEQMNADINQIKAEHQETVKQYQAAKEELKTIEQRHQMIFHALKDDKMAMQHELEMANDKLHTMIEEANASQKEEIELRTKINQLETSLAATKLELHLCAGRPLPSKEQETLAKMKMTLEQTIIERDAALDHIIKIEKEQQQQQQHNNNNNKKNMTNNDKEEEDDDNDNNGEGHSREERLLEAIDRLENQNGRLESLVELANSRLQQALADAAVAEARCRESDLIIDQHKHKNKTLQKELSEAVARVSVLEKERTNNSNRNHDNNQEMQWI